MDPVHGKYINLIQVDSDRKEWAEFLSKIDKLKYKKGVDYTMNNTGNPSAYFKAEVANNAKVKELRKKYNVSSFGIEGVDQTNIIGQIISGAKVFLKETKEIATIGTGNKNEYGWPVILENGNVVRRNMHEFVVITENVDVEKLEYNPYAVCHTTVDKEADPEKFDRCVKHVVDQQTESTKRKSLDESLDELLKKKITESIDEHHLHTREDKIAFILDKTKNHPAGQYDAAKLMSMSDDELDTLYNWVETDSHLYEEPINETSSIPYTSYEEWCDDLESELGPGILYKDLNDNEIVAYTSYGQKVGKWNGVNQTGIIINPSFSLNETTAGYDEAEAYVLYLLNNRHEELFDQLGLDMPAQLVGDEFEQAFEQAKELGIEYYMHHPEEIDYSVLEEGKASYKSKDVKLIPTKDSSFIKAAGYDPEMETMYLQFAQGVYEYYDVPEDVYRALLAAPSMGKFFHQNIRHTYSYALAKKYMTRGRKPLDEHDEYQHAEDYVDYLLGGDWEELFSKIGLNVPANADATEFIPLMDKARALGIEYFTSHPEEIDHSVITEKVNKLKSSTPYFNNKVEKLPTMEGVEGRDAMEQYIAKHAGELTSDDEKRYQIATLDYDEVLDTVKQLGNQDIDYLYKKLRTNNTIDLGNQMNEQNLDEILGFKKPKPQVPEGEQLDEILGFKKIRPHVPEGVTLQEYVNTPEGKVQFILSYGDLAGVRLSKDQLAAMDGGELDRLYNKVYKDPRVAYMIEPSASRVRREAEGEDSEDNSVEEPSGADKYNDDFSDMNSDVDDDNMEEPAAEEELDIPEIIDFRNTEDGLTFTPDTEEYKALRAIHDDEQLWDEYVELMKDAGVNVVCDDLTDAYKVTWSDADVDDVDMDFDSDDETEGEPVMEPAGDETEEEITEYLGESAKTKERFRVDESAKLTVKKIVEGKGYKFITLRGSFVESKQPDIYELIVEKNGNRSSIVYNDNTKVKPWNWNKGTFQHLQECLDAIHIPFKKLVNETAQIQIDEEVKARRVQDDTLNEWAYKTDGLSKEEKERRAKRGSDVFNKIINEEQSKRGFNR